MTADYLALTRAEWIKLRSVRSTLWTLSAMVVGGLALSAIVAAVVDTHWSGMSAADRASWDPTNQSLVGTLIAQLAIGVLGVLAVTSEFGTGTIRASLAAVPRRPRLTLAKCAVYGGVAVAVGELTSFASFAICQAIFSGHVPTASLTHLAVVRAVTLTGLYCGMVCLLSLGLGLIIRHTAGAISAMVGVFLILPGITAILPISVENSVGRFLPNELAGGSMAAVVPESHMLPVGIATLLMTAYTVAAVIAGNQLLRRRDV